MQAIFGNKILFFGLVIAELGLVFFLSARVEQARAGDGVRAISCFIRL